MCHFFGDDSRLRRSVVSNGHPGTYSSQPCRGRQRAPRGHLLVAVLSTFKGNPIRVIKLQRIDDRSITGSKEVLDP